MRIFKTVVREVNGMWEFKWRNVGFGIVGSEGPFASKAEAEHAEKEFMETERRKHPDTTRFETEIVPFAGVRLGAT